jgi:hypothetical protein
VQSVSSARFVTLPLTRRKQEALKQLLEQFAASVNFCIRKCLEHGVTSRASLHRVAYGEWKSKFNQRPTGSTRQGRWRPRRCDPGESFVGGGRQILRSHLSTRPGAYA